MAKKPADAEGNGEKKGKGKRKLLIIIGVVVVIAAGAFAGLQFLGGSDAEAGEEASESEPPAEGEVLDVATLTTVAGGNSLARVGLAVVLSETATADTVSGRFPLLKDAAVSELASTMGEDLRTAEGADALRRRLTKRAKEDIYPDGEVLRVLITELVIQ
ncbi:MAG TPA: flagellar basal body-associated FliL family protein [Euzebyales bacterium]|nr:flagellar basal body-associated FliL family protein [Euzebyales bacterium]